jgi:hypothetical protein
MILTTASEQTKSLTSEQVKLLRAECDDVTARMEAGWLIVIGYKGDKRLVLAHCNSQEEYETKMGVLRPSNSWNGYGEDGSGYAFSATATYEKDGQNTDTEVCYFCRDTRYLGDAEDEVKALCAENLREATDGEVRKIKFSSIYWDDIPRNRRVLTLEQSNTPTP